MGVFLQVAIFPGSDVSTITQVVQQSAQKKYINLDVNACQYVQSPLGVQARLEGELGFECLAEELSQNCGGAVMLLYIYDSDFWAYDYFFAGKVVDHFRSCPAYFDDKEEKWKHLIGNPTKLVDNFPIQSVKTIVRYFPLYLKNKVKDDEFAYPGDQYPYGDCWQMMDFMARLGFPWAFDNEDVDEPSIPSPQPSLIRILEESILPCPAGNGMDEDAKYPFVKDLYTALSPAYIRNILQQENYRQYAQMTPQEILAVHSTAKQSSTSHLDIPFYILSAFSEYWQGNPSFAFEILNELIEKGTSNMELLRARGMLVPVFSKRHIAIKDLSQLIALDPINQDVYLLCRAYFYGIWGQKINNARTDLNALAKLGTLHQDDTRLNFSAFDPEFLKDPESFFRREQEYNNQRVNDLLEKLNEEKRLREEKEARRLQLIKEKLRKKKKKQ